MFSAIESRISRLRSNMMSLSLVGSPASCASVLVVGVALPPFEPHMLKQPARFLTVGVPPFSRPRVLD